MLRTTRLPEPELAGTAGADFACALVFAEPWASPDVLVAPSVACGPCSTPPLAAPVSCIALAPLGLLPERGERDAADRGRQRRRRARSARDRWRDQNVGRRPGLREDQGTGEV